PYPKDGMNWDQVTQLAKTMTRKDGGIQYYGLYPGGFALMVGQSNLPFYDAKSFKATLADDRWKQVYQTYKDIENIPGNKITANNIPMFEKDQVISMMADYGARIAEIEALAKAGTPLNFDIATFPESPINPKKTAELQVHMLILSSLSKNVDAAYKVL